MAAQVLVRLGVDLGLARRRVTALMSGQAPGEQPDDVSTGFVRTQFANVGRTSTEPRCPQCRADLTDGTRFRTILVPPDAEEGEKDPLPTYVVYCRRCGVSLHMFTRRPLVPARGAVAPDLGGSGVLTPRRQCDGSEEPEAGRNEVAVGLEDERRHATDVEGVEERTPG